MKQHYIIKGLKFTLFVILAIFVFGYVFMHLWNWLMPDIFGLTEITWHQAIGLVLLSKIIFGFGKGGHKKCCGHNVESKVKRHFNWKNKMKERYDNMTDEEKEKFKNKCGSWIDPDNDC